MLFVQRQNKNNKLEIYARTPDKKQHPTNLTIPPHTHRANSQQLNIYVLFEFYLNQEIN